MHQLKKMEDLKKKQERNSSQLLKEKNLTLK